MELSGPEIALLRELASGASTIAELAGQQDQAKINALAQQLEDKGLLHISTETSTLWHLSDEGQRFKEIGLPERRAANGIAEAGGQIPMGQLAKFVDKSEVSITIGWLKRKGWASMEKTDAGTQLVLGDCPIGDDEKALSDLATSPAPMEGPGIQMLASRGGVVVETEQKVRSIALTAQGQELLPKLEQMQAAESIGEITPELIGRWSEMSEEERANVSLRPFAFDADVNPRMAAKPHPLSQLMSQIRNVFWQMGFQQIRGDFVESAFWNMDSLFIPQDHPAREEQDTFYLENPQSLAVDDEDLSRVKNIHETGGDTGSTGWGGTWSKDVARQGLLRTHTTNTTVRYLAKHFGDNASGQEVHRVFGLGRVFRNETMDATHLPEFHQIEGIVTEPDATFDMLIGMCRHFFTAMGFPEVRFRPAYFPYTEPSMEIEVFYNGKWMELGGCGVFRPEVTEPLGVPHPVLAWGFGLERLAMMRLGLTDIRQLYVPDLAWLESVELL